MMMMMIMLLITFTVMVVYLNILDSGYKSLFMYN
jgi:hypothetical protein